FRRECRPGVAEATRSSEVLACSGTLVLSIHFRGRGEQMWSADGRHTDHTGASVRLLLLELTNHESAMNNRTERASRKFRFFEKVFCKSRCFYFDLQKTLTVKMNERIFVYFERTISLYYLVFLYVFFEV